MQWIYDIFHIGHSANLTSVHVLQYINSKSLLLCFGCCHWLVWKFSGSTLDLYYFVEEMLWTVFTYSSEFKTKC